MSTDNCSFFEHLTKFTEEYEATDLSRLFIRVIAFNVCSAKRNTFTTYRLVEILRDICNEIGKLITTVEGNADVTAWGAYDTYTAAIGPLETFLYELLIFTDEADFQEFLGKATTVSEAINSVATWATSREKLRTFVRDVFAKTEFKFQVLKPTQFNFEERFDDLALLSALCDGISKHELKVPDVKASAANIATAAKTTPSDKLFQSIRCTMIVHGAMVLSQNETKVKNSPSVWKQATKLLKHVESYLSGQYKQPDHEANLENGWNELKRLLEDLRPVLPEGYLTLRRDAKNVRRPYHARTLALIKMCKDLAEEFSKEGTNTSVNLRPLDTALTAASKALEEGKTALLTADIDHSDNHFTIAAKRVDECRTAYKLEPHGQGTSEMQAASAEDKRWMQKLKDFGVDKLIGKKELPTNKQVNVKVSYTLGTGPKTEKTYKVDVQTRLSMILWEIISEQSNQFPRDKLVGAYFEASGAKKQKFAFTDEVGTSELDLTLRMA